MKSTSLFERDGVLASLSPSVPERSLFNSVVNHDPAALDDSLDELTRVYEEAGVDAWTVWVPERDQISPRTLAARGHLLDASPREMVIDLTQAPAHRDGELQHTDELEWASLCEINDVAYGYRPGSFERGLGSRPDPGYRCYGADLDGRPASVLTTLEHDRDCLVTFVATLPEARGKGLASRLLAQALSDAYERGCRSSTLQATKSGAPLYLRLGYADIGELQMWEQRKAS